MGSVSAHMGLPFLVPASRRASWWSALVQLALLQLCSGDPGPYVCRRYFSQMLYLRCIHQQRSHTTRDTSVGTSGPASPGGWGPHPRARSCASKGSGGGSNPHWPPHLWRSAGPTTANDSNRHATIPGRALREGRVTQQLQYPPSVQPPSLPRHCGRGGDWFPLGTAGSPSFLPALLSIPALSHPPQ